MIRRLIAAAVALLAASTAPAAPLDDIAQRYVKMSLEAGEREPGYVDSYYGPPEWAEAARKAPRSFADLRGEAQALARALAAIDPRTLDAMSVRRRAYLQAQVKAATTRLSMDMGEKFPFQDEADGLFGVRPQLKPLAAYDPVLARIDRLVPGPGALADRVDALLDRYIVPADKVEPVMRAAIAECRARTMRHIALPSDERFDLGLVTGKSWSGYNWYKGNAHSLIEINTDLPVRIGRAAEIGCHEGYPGHHVLNMLLERKLARGRGWVEFTINPLFGPQGTIAEGTANYGVHLAFPGEELEAFEAKTLFPLAGLDPGEAPRLAALRDAMDELAGARLTIAEMYLDGKIDREQAIALSQKYQLLSRTRAEHGLGFTEQYRSYVINYATGKDMAQAYVERAGPSPAARWARFEAVISEPTVPADLLPK
ncbi:hypothetical protein [Sphingomonas quercus]|uniref:DUF885 domain-containing protein n=1 Tax=Sphingomonas quercus TaxID=2842451 RepID=A0ABS6BGK2_9SPHN|nr:hypothetical protein [Sphingomonas quercus]MBU3076404.1 hypothetical protein [Sphingomonas quercus]